MLPFLKKQAANQAGIIIKERVPDDPDKSQENQELEACASDLIKAVQSGSAKSVASAFQAMLSVCQSEPLEPHSYEASFKE